MDMFGEPLKEFTKRLTKKTETQPGWLYLLIFTYLILVYVGVPKRLVVGAWATDLPKLSIEIWVALVTYITYQIGDVLDKVTFKKRGETGEWDVQRYEPPTLVQARDTARTALGIRGGSYGVALKILEAAKEGRFSVHFINESAKFFRSLIVPAYLISLILASTLPFRLWLLLAVTSTAIVYGLAYHVYPRMKVRHMTNLYQAIPSIMAEDQRREPENANCSYRTQAKSGGSCGMVLKLRLPESRLTTRSTRTPCKPRSLRASCRAPLSGSVRRRRYQSKNRRTISNVRRRLFLTRRNTLEDAGGNV